MLVRFARKFEKQRRKAPKKIKGAFSTRLELFIESPFHPLLDNHKLSGQYRHYRSIDVTGDWRALYREYIDEANNKTIIFELIGTHSELYK